MRGGTSAHSARRGEAVVHRNLKDVVEATEAFCNANGCTRLVLAGSDSNLGQFRDMLPKALQDRVIGSFAVDAAASVGDVQARSLDLIEHVAENREIELVDEMISGWKRGSGATAGLSDTLLALQEHRPWILLVAAGYEASGVRCQNCRFLMLTEREECPLCGGKVERVEDLVETMVHRALEQGVEIEIVRDNEKLAEAGSIGSLLRY
jgi:peptide subunit release factor 1 (eRF1)